MSSGILIALPCGEDRDSLTFQRSPLVRSTTPTPTTPGAARGEPIELGLELRRQLCPGRGRRR